MVYQTTKPAPNDDLDVSVTDIQQNFLTANTVMDIDHYPFNNLTANKGYHKVIHQPPVVTPAAIASIGQLYVKDVTVNAVTDTQLFFKTGMNGESQLTGNSAGTNGYQWLGGVLLQWGIIAPNTNSDTLIDLTIAPNFTFPTAIYNIQFSTQRPGNDPGSAFEFYIDNGTITTSSFHIKNRSGHSYGYYWLAIGS